MRLLLLLACNETGLSNQIKNPEGDTGIVCPDPGAFRAQPAADCKVDPPTGGFSPTVEWQWSSQASGYDDIMSTPVVGNLNDDNADGRIDADDIPDIVFSSFSNGGYTVAGALTATSGDGSGDHWSILDAGGYHPHGSAGVAIGDFEADGAPEVCVAGMEVAVICLHADGSLRWASGTGVYGYGFPAFADLDEDGRSELIFGNQVYDADGNLLWTGAGGAGRWTSFAMDVDQDGSQEVVAGNTIYNADGSIRVQNSNPDGPCAAADFDLDGNPEWVHVSSGTVYLNDLSGATRWATAVPQGGGGPPTVADFDADGYPEVGVAGAYYYVVFDNDGSILWQNPVQDYSSSVTGSSVFDFEGDGKADVVYSDEVILWVFDGATGAVKLQEDNHASGTLYEYPLIVDVDNDGATEIVLASNNYGFPGWNGISVIGDSNGSWRPSRPIWNQYAYNIRNVEDDGSIPRNPDPFWKSFNNFRTGGTSLGLGSELADLEPGEPEICCGRQELELWIPISNLGLAASGVAEVRVTAGGQRLYSEEVELNPGAGRHVGPVTITKGEWNDPVKVSVDREDLVEECAEDNNVIELGAWPCD